MSGYFNKWRRVFEVEGHESSISTLGFISTNGCITMFILFILNRIQTIFAIGAATVWDKGIFKNLVTVSLGKPDITMQISQSKLSMIAVASVLTILVFYISIVSISIRRLSTNQKSKKVFMLVSLLDLAVIQVFIYSTIMYGYGTNMVYKVIASGKYTSSFFITMIIASIYLLMMLLGESEEIALSSQVIDYTQKPNSNILTTSQIKNKKDLGTNVFNQE